ncbi:2-alkenal reductase [Cohnella kolymensis]|uniref:Chaperone protein DnaK n=1 Tax=Cohnella kolymensis TaxID=1590652 RepID=A0ABR5A3A5_9BACL|nr:molecular chaperone HscC [Cohnella kolymensis]KIL35481.1 2-alkenal reductase [Cohnella kolymensis]
MTIIGIDLGTTNSAVSFWKEQGSVMIPNALGHNLTPSVVSIDDHGEVLIGEIAKERQITHPDMSASVFKRHMGTKKKYRLGTKEFLPEELSALIIGSLRQDAEHFLGHSVHEAVISVPAYFSDAQKRATKRAGELAGLKVERLITEPTAAAISYGLHLRNADTKFLVFDLGGGTFDVSILELFENVMEVRAVTGDNYLGGEDFTDVLTSLFLKQHSLNAGQLDRKTLTLLRKQAEIAKRAFNESKTTTITCSIQDEVYSQDITLDEFEAASKHLFHRLRDPIERALNDATLKIKDLDAILLVGGATKLPIIRSFVSKLFGQLAYANINPDEVVAMGAGIQAALKGKDAMLKEVILTDVCPYTLGTTVSVRKAGYHESGHFLPIIERNTTIPISRVERLYTLHDNQKVINIDILQGESRLSKDNIYLGELNVPVPAKPAGEEAIDVRFTYDVNGILQVEVTVVSTGMKKEMVIEKDPGHMSKEEIVRSIESLSQLKIHPREHQENRLIMARGERLFEEKIGDVRLEIGQLLRAFEEVLEKQDTRQIKEMRNQLKDIFDSIDTKGGF